MWQINYPLEDTETWMTGSQENVEEITDIQDTADARGWETPQEFGLSQTHTTEQIQTLQQQWQITQEEEDRAEAQQEDIDETDSSLFAVVDRVWQAITS